MTTFKARAGYNATEGVQFCEYIINTSDKYEGMARVWLAECRQSCPTFQMLALAHERAVELGWNQ